MSANGAPGSSGSAFLPVRAVGAVYGWLDQVPYWLLAIPLRIAVAWVFWSSALTHLASWQTTLYLFATDCRLPFLPPVLAAYIAVSIEVATPPLLVFGLLTRPAALLLLGMTLVIEIFVYPQAWPTHIEWAAMLLVLLCRGPGLLSLDRLASAAARRRGRMTQGTVCAGGACVKAVLRRIVKALWTARVLTLAALAFRYFAPRLLGT